MVDVGKKRSCPLQRISDVVCPNPVLSRDRLHLAHTSPCSILESITSSSSCDAMAVRYAYTRRDILLLRSSPPSNKSFYYLLLQPMLLCSSVRNSSSFSRNLEKSRAISRLVAGFFIMGRYLKDVNISWPFIFIIWFKNEKWITTLYSMHDEFPIQSAKVLTRICKTDSSRHFQHNLCEFKVRFPFHIMDKPA